MSDEKTKQIHEVLTGERSLLTGERLDSSDSSSLSVNAKAIGELQGRVSEHEGQMKALEDNVLRALEGLETRTATLKIAQKATTVAMELMRLGIAELIARDKEKKATETAT